MDGVMEYHPIGQAANSSSCNWIKRELTAFSSEAEKFEFAKDFNDRTAALNFFAEVYSFDDKKMGHTRRKVKTVKMNGV